MILKKIKNKTISFIKILLSTFIVFSIFSCTDEELSLKKTEAGIPTEIVGNVKEFRTNTDISGIKISVIRYNYGFDSDSESIGPTQILGSAYTDSNGNYSIKFNHNLKKYIRSYEYRIAYSVANKTNDDKYYIPGEDYQNTNILVNIGQTTTKNLKVTKMTELELTLNVLNNNNGSLFLEYVNYIRMDMSIFQIPEANTTKVYKFYTVPNKNFIISYFYTANGGRRIKNISFGLNLSPLNVLNYTIDCSTF